MIDADIFPAKLQPIGWPSCKMKFSIKKSTDLNPLDSLYEERILSGLAHYQICPLTDYDAKEEGRVARTFQGLTRIPRLNQEKFDN